mgnify:CR=1 FL=1
MKNSIEKYNKKLSSVLKKISIKENKKIKIIANKLSDNYINGGIVYVFGTGHNHCIAEESLHRAGAFAGAMPILDKRIDFSYGIEKASEHERNPKLAKDILKNYTFKEEDSVIIFSNSGVNKLSIEIAKILKNKKLYVIVVTSKIYSDSLKKNKKTKLYYFSDLYIDNYSPVGDTLINYNHIVITSSSTIAGIFILNSLWLEMSIKLKQYRPFPFYKSSNLPNSNKHNRILEKKYNLINTKLK